MKIRFLFHKGKDSWVGKGIVIWTWILAVVRLDFKSLKCNFSHVEIWFPDENEEFQIRTWVNGPDDKMPFMGCTGQCFSSTTRGDAEGVRFAPASEVLKHPERWMYEEFEVINFAVEDLIEKCKGLVGRKYDYWGLFGFFNPWNTEDEDKDYCSERISWCAWKLFMYAGKLIKRISPRRLAKVLGGELKELA